MARPSRLLKIATSSGYKSIKDWLSAELAVEGSVNAVAQKHDLHPNSITWYLTENNLKVVHTAKLVRRQA